MEIAKVVKTGLGIYFIGLFFPGINIIAWAYLSATEYPRGAFVISIMRGTILIIPLVLLLSSIWTMIGVWLSFVFTEGIVTIIVFFVVKVREQFKIPPLEDGLQPLYPKGGIFFYLVCRKN